jgi:hypothetical protein
MLILITTAILVFITLFKALLVAIGAAIGLGLFAIVAAGLLWLMLRSLIEGLMDGWKTSSNANC